MADHSEWETDNGQPDDAFVRELADLGPLMRRKADVETQRPNQQFLEDLWVRLMKARRQRAGNIDEPDRHSDGDGQR
jgi:hypothetical protein